MIRKHLLVSGTVQGVYYRDTCRRIAAERGINGWVRNLPDGRVEAVLEGAPDAVEALIDWAWHGPDSADVTDVAAADEPVEHLAGFTVR